ncbi:MAG: 3-oxoacyl-ACP reductase FabG [Lachnospiraceae bacterium]|nr:3-oxoacyl-ACP reductase FabG [Lachnospiraceae bacterium]
MKTALVTGASRGIGRAIALKLAENGYAVGINCANNSDRLAETAKMIEEAGGRCELFFGNVSDPAFVKEMFRKMEENYGHLDLLVNNAGISKVGLFTDMTDDDWREICGVNLDGAVWCSREASRMMVREHRGKIVNISSMWGQVGASCEVMYSATKGGLDALTKALAKELAPSNIQVNAISCGVIDTDMNRCFSEEDREELKNEIPAGRFGEAEEVADLLLDLVSGNDYLTGQIIRLDGGMI